MNPRTKVVNKYKEDYDIYIGRGSKWGNPFAIGEPVVFYSGSYMGYLDSLFYYAFDLDDWKTWWDFDN